MTWHRIPLTAGVVNTRSPASMRPGECESVKNARLRAGDLLELHRDYDRAQIHSVTAPEEILHLFVASFEDTGEYLVLVTKDSTNLYIKTAPAGGGGLTTQATYTHGGAVTKAWSVHRGNEYFIGTNATTQRTLVLSSDLSVREAGLEASGLSVSLTASPVGESSADQYDIFVYWATEYDPDNDVESNFDVAGGGAKKIIVPTAGDTLEGLFGGGFNNSSLTVARLYRHYCGTGNSTSTSTGNTGTWTDADFEAQRYLDGRSPLLGGLVQELDLAVVFNLWSDDLNSKFDPAGVPFPQIYYDQAGVTLIDDYLTKPQKWHMGALFNDCLVVSSGSLARFSPPGAPEYQPTINAFYFLTERSDEIVGLHAVNDSLVALTSGGVHRVDYLQHEFNIASALGKAQRTISTLDGCVGRYAHALVDIEGELRSFVVFLSHTGLRMTDGQRVFDACPDWSVAGTGIAASDLASCVLVADPANHRLRLFVPNGSVSDTWDFYYHGSLLADGRFRVFGPTAHDGLVTTADYGYINGSPTLFTASTTTVWKEGVGETASDIEVLTGWLRPSRSPMNELRQDALGIEHDADADGTITLTGYGKIHGQAEVSAGGAAPTSLYEEASYAADAGLRGNRLRSKVVVSGHSRIGPLLVDFEEEEGGAA